MLNNVPPERRKRSRLRIAWKQATEEAMRQHREEGFHDRKARRTGCEKRQMIQEP